MDTAQQLMPVPFYEDTVVLVDSENEPFVSMKPIVINMGLSWQGQYEKLIEKFGATIKEILTVAEDGKSRAMICLPLRKLPAWLYSISPNKVKAELRDKIIRYQNECDDALWDYWTKGNATRPRAQPAASRIANHRLRLSLAKELHRTRDPELRKLIHEQLADVSNSLGLSVPPIESLGRQAANVPDDLKAFWDALAYLDSQGVPYNHTQSPTRLALNLPQLARLLREHGQPIRLSTDLRQGLWQSTGPRCLHKNHTCYSHLTGKALKCWIFAK